MTVRLVVALLVLLMAGCAPTSKGFVAEQEEIAFRRGKQRLREGRPDEALEAFISVIQRREKAPESHLEAGLLYLNRFNEPVLAIYHFEAYLREKPNSEQADRVKQLMVTAKKEFARALPASPFGDEVDNLDLKELLDKTRAENESLKAEIVKAREEIERYKAIEEAKRTLKEVAPSMKSPDIAAKAAGAPAAAAGGGNKTHTVDEGDTLSSIAKKYYGASSRWQEIYEANRDTMRSPSALKIGQQLRIP